MTVTFSFPLLESGRSTTCVDELPVLDGVSVGFRRDLDEVEDGVVVCLAPAPLGAVDGGSGAGDFLDLNGEIDDLKDLVAEDIGCSERSVDGK